jgi:hypothetical protein
MVPYDYIQAHLSFSIGQTPGLARLMTLEASLDSAPLRTTEAMESS